ncbi:unnamed protein product [Tilletia controversa]|nr:unnamed protein product [Tilletia controversa]
MSSLSTSQPCSQPSQTWPPLPHTLAGASAARIHSWAATAVHEVPTTATADPSPHTALLAGLLLLKLASPLIIIINYVPTRPGIGVPAQTVSHYPRSAAVCPRKAGSQPPLLLFSTDQLRIPLRTPRRTPNTRLSQHFQPRLHVFFQQDTHQGPNHLRPQPTSSKDSYTSLYAQPPHNHTTRLSSVRLSSEQTQVERLRKMAAHKQCEAERKAADAASSGTPMSKEEAEEEEDTKA